MGGPGAASHRGRSQACLASLCSRPKCAGAWPHPCLRTRGLAVPAWCSHLVARGAARSEAATDPSFPAQENTTRRPIPNTFLARRRRRPRARSAQEPPPSRHGSPAARRPASRHVHGRRVSTSPIHHRKETKGEERIDWPGGAHGGAAV
jgi:hypothetical protein